VPADVLILTTRPDNGAAWRSDLTARGYSVSVEELNLEAWPEEAEARLASVVLLDVPAVAQVELADLRRLKQVDGRTPLVVIIGEGDIISKVHALDAGADICLAREVSAPEIVARVSSLLRRVPFGARSITLSEGDLSLDLVHGSAEYAGRKLELSAYEFRILRSLAIGVMECRARFASVSGDDRLTEAQRRLRSYAEEVEELSRIDPGRHRQRFPRGSEEG